MMNQHQVMRAKLMLVYAFDGIRLGSCDFNFFFFFHVLIFFFFFKSALRYASCYVD